MSGDAFRARPRAGPRAAREALSAAWRREEGTAPRRGTADRRSSRRKAAALLALALALLPAAPAGAAAQAPAADTTSPRMTVFVAEGCPHCAEAKVWLEGLRARRPGLEIEVLDVRRSDAALERFRQVARDHDLAGLAVPTFVVDDRILVGFAGAEATGPAVEALLDGPAPAASDGGESPEAEEDATPPAGPDEDACTAESLEADECVVESGGEAVARTVNVPLLGAVSVQELGLPLFTVALGLLDGFNPCAMWVLLFLLSILVNLQSRRRMLAVGGTFVLVSGLVYFAFMAAWLNVFVLIGISRAVQAGLGGVALLVGGLNMKDFFAFGRGASVGIPGRAKPTIYQRVRRILDAENMTGALGAVVVLALLVNVVELVCTAGLPALFTQILTLRQLSWPEYYGYLALYNVCYMLDDALVLGVAVWTLSHHRLQQKEARWLKLVSGVVMAALGLVLLLWPGLLT